MPSLHPRSSGSVLLLDLTWCPLRNVLCLTLRPQISLYQIQAIALQNKIISPSSVYPALSFLRTQARPQSWFPSKEFPDTPRSSVTEPQGKEERRTEGSIPVVTCASRSCCLCLTPPRTPVQSSISAPGSHAFPHQNPQGPGWWARQRDGAFCLRFTPRLLHRQEPPPGPVRGTKEEGLPCREINRGSPGSPATCPAGRPSSRRLR